MLTVRDTITILLAGQEFRHALEIAACVCVPEPGRNKREGPASGIWGPGKSIPGRMAARDTMGPGGHLSVVARNIRRSISGFPSAARLILIIHHSICN